MDQRPDPDQLLKRVQAEEQASSRGQLKLFFGANAGVGKTYAMLEAARQRKKENVDVVVGVVETHGRSETAALLEGLEIIPRRAIEYKGFTLQEFDLDAALTRRPALILIDELAHTNAPGSRHTKRWQDVEELLDSGIDVYTTVNVQHWESLNDVVAQITGVVVRETVPDTLLSRAHELELVDISPDDLLKRLKDGKVYRGEQADRAADHFFQPGNLIALRELALRHAAERVDAQVQSYKEGHAITGVWPIRDRLLVAVTASPMSVRLVRSTMRLATRLRCEWIVATVETPSTVRLTAHERARLNETLRLADQLGAETVTLSGQDVAGALIDFARSRNVTRIILGKPAHPRWRERLFGSVLDTIARRCGDIDLYVISGMGGEFSSRRPKAEAKPVAWKTILQGVAVVAASTLFCWPLFHRLDRANLIMIYLVGVVWCAYKLGRQASLWASILSVMAFDFFFVPPYLTFAVSDAQYLITFAIMLGVGLFISTITGWLRTQTEGMQQRERRLQALHKLSRTLSETPDPGGLLQAAWNHLTEFYRLPVLLLVPDGKGGLRAEAGHPQEFGLSEKEAATAVWVLDHAEAAGAGTDTLSGSTGLYVPLKGIQKTMGVLGIRSNDSERLIEPESFRLLERFAAEIGGALESTKMTEDAGRAKAEIETERIRTMLLSTFSYDLREPLTRIVRRTEELLNAPLTDVSRQKLLREIQDESSRISRLIEDLPNLLT